MITGIAIHPCLPYFDPMEFFREVSKRRKSIAEEMDSIRREDRLWEVTYMALFHYDELLLENDLVSRKTAQKFAILAMVAEEFNDRRRTRHPGAKFDRIFRRVKNKIGDVPEGTVRSYLSRFKSEGRIDFDSEKSLWVIKKRD